jgi:hypothetical protein
LHPESIPPRDAVISDDVESVIQMANVVLLPSFHMEIEGSFPFNGLLQAMLQEFGDVLYMLDGDWVASGEHCFVGVKECWFSIFFENGKSFHSLTKLLN